MIGYKKKEHPREADSFRSNDERLLPLCERASGKIVQQFRNTFLNLKPAKNLFFYVQSLELY